MRIIVLTSHWFPEDVTAQRRWKDLAQRLVDAGHFVDLLCPPPHYPGGTLISDLPEHQRFAVERVESRFRIFRTDYCEHDYQLISRIKDQWVQLCSAYKLAGKLTKQQEYDLVIASAPPLNTLFAGWTVSKRRHLPFLLDLRDAWPELLGYVLADESHRPSLTTWKRVILHGLANVTRPVCKICIKGADGIIVTSDYLRKNMLEIGMAKTGRIITLRNLSSIQELSIDSQKVSTSSKNQSFVPDTDKTDNNDFKVSKTAEKDTLNLLYAGTVGRAQGILSTLRAIALAQKEGAKICFRVVGAGAHLKTLKNNAEKLGVSVEFYRRLPFSQMAEHYDWADSELIQLQNWKPLERTVPSKLYDAMLAKRHITLVAVGESADLVHTHEAGLVASPPLNLADFNSERKIANAFVQLWKERSNLKVSDSGRLWVKEQLTDYRRGTSFLKFVEQTVRKNNLNKLGMQVKPRVKVGFNET